MEVGDGCKETLKCYKRTYKSEDPGPSRSSTNAIHVFDGGSKQPRKSACELNVNFSAKDIQLEMRLHNAPKLPRKSTQFYMISVRMDGRIPISAKRT